jgi:nickel transport protein
MYPKLRPRCKGAAVYVRVILLCAMSLPWFAPPVEGHGTGYEILGRGGITIRAFFASGEPIARADVKVFAPRETEPHATLTTDADGVFTFRPDRPGVWVLQVRDRGGHGVRINCDVNDDMVVEQAAGAGRIGAVQKTIMAACVIWGFVGTALFFRRNSVGA